MFTGFVTCSGWLFRAVLHMVPAAASMVHAWQNSMPCLSSFCVQVRTEDDELWTPDTREGHAEIRARGAAFLRWLLARTAPQSPHLCQCVVRRTMRRLHESELPGL